jgi:hypothetical protein
LSVKAVVRTALPLLLGFLIFAVGSAWALATPPMSEGDADYHITTVVCTGNGSQFCEQISDAAVRVPRVLAVHPCYINDRSQGASCFQWTPEIAETTRWNSSSSYRSQTFYNVMALMIGDDLWRSIINMRLLNSAIAGLFFSLAFLLAGARVRIALGFAVLTILIPIGMFHVAAVNPGAWSVIGLGTFWAFLMTFWTARSISRGIRILSGVLAGVAGVIALAGRPDSAIYLIAGAVGVALLQRHYLRRHLTMLIPLAVLAVPIALLASDRITSSLTYVSTSLPGIAESFFQWWPRFHMLEWSLLMSYVVGGATPAYMPYPLSYTAGLGWDNRAGIPIEFPSIVGLAGAAVLVSVLWLGLSRYSWRKLVAVSLITGSIVLMSLGYVWFTNFAVWAQARYYFGPMMMLVGFATLMPLGKPLLRSAQVAVLAVGASVAASAALITVVRTTTNGQPLVPDRAWSVYEADEDWWWSSIGVELPLSANGLIMAGVVVSTLMVVALLFLIQWESCRFRSAKGT